MLHESNPPSCRTRLPPRTPRLRSCSGSRPPAPTTKNKCPRMTWVTLEQKNVDCMTWARKKTNHRYITWVRQKRHVETDRKDTSINYMGWGTASPRIGKISFLEDIMKTGESRSLIHPPGIGTASCNLNLLEQHWWELRCGHQPGRYPWVIHSEMQHNQTHSGLHVTPCTHRSRTCLTECTSP